MAAAIYRAWTPLGQEFMLSIGTSDMLAVPMPRPEGEEDFVNRINRVFHDLAEMETEIVQAGGRCERLP